MEYALLTGYAKYDKRRVRGRSCRAAQSDLEYATFSVRTVRLTANSLHGVNPPTALLLQFP